MKERKVQSYEKHSHFFCFLLLFCSCATVRTGRDFDPRIVKTFEKGKTTPQNVFQKLGEPFFQSIDGEGNLVWVNMYTESSYLTIPPIYYSIDIQERYTVNAPMSPNVKALYLLFKGDYLSDWTMQGAEPQWGDSNATYQETKRSRARRG